MYASGHPAAATKQADSHPVIFGYDAITFVSTAFVLAVSKAARQNAATDLNRGFTGIASSMAAIGQSLLIVLDGAVRSRPLR